MLKKVGVSSTYTRVCKYINNRANSCYANALTPTVNPRTCQVNDTSRQIFVMPRK